ncbi:hypothetical protein [Thiolapillus sp.]|uniref:hypothetical protein n=1 Tax=Thiolapillus sp. TaxID=2017437 RepID=UPI003AF45AB8
MELIIIEMTEEQKTVIERIKKLYGQQWRKELLGMFKHDDYSSELTNNQVKELKKLKNTIEETYIKFETENMTSINDALLNIH